MYRKHFDLDIYSFYYCDYICEGTYFDRAKDDWIDLPGRLQSTSGGKIFIMIIISLLMEKKVKSNIKN